MKFSFENLGPIVNGEIELGDLTVICGENNTGKTYLTYAMYGFLRNWREYLSMLLTDATQLEFDELYDIDLQTVAAEIDEMLSRGTESYSKNIGEVFGTNGGRFLDTNVKLDVALPSPAEILSIEHTQSIDVGLRKNFITIEKQRGDAYLRLTTTTDLSNLLLPSTLFKLVNTEVQKILFEPIMPRTFIFSTERTGAVTFRNELNLTKTRIIEAAQRFDSNQASSSSGFLEQIQNSSYPLPVRDNVDFLNSLSTFSHYKSFLAVNHPVVLEQFKQLVGGEYHLDPVTDEVFFQPSNVKGVKLRMRESSSSVRSFVLLNYYLYHVAAKGDLLIIDEPELNLHPVNQRRMARLIARLVNVGIKVLITTHSDYIVRELNNLIVLKGLGEKAAEIKTRRDYQDTELLDSCNFKLYTLERDQGTRKDDQQKLRPGIVRISTATVTQSDGIESTTFDETISDMNALYAELLNVELEEEENGD